MTIWREGYEAVLVDPSTTVIVNGVTAGTVTGTTQQDGYYDVHIEDADGVRATYRNLELRRTGHKWSGICHN
jgi:hypothetical protein